MTMMIVRVIFSIQDDSQDDDVDIHDIGDKEEDKSFCQHCLQ